MRAWFLAKSIRTQISMVAIGPLVLVTLLAILTQPLTLGDVEDTSYAKATAIRIEMIVAQMRVAQSSAEVAAILDTAGRAGLHAKVVPATDLLEPSQSRMGDRDVRDLVRHNLPASLQPVLRARTSDGRLKDVIVVRRDADTAIAFAPALSGADPWINDTQIGHMLMALVVVLPVMLLSFHVGRMITAPLTHFVDTAQELDPDDGPKRPFPEGGSLEMVNLASSLNDKGSRIRDMLDARTRILRAISHDLRTLLTRLRMRAERSTQPDLRGAMLNDIKRIDEMIEDSLTFLNRIVSAETPISADLPSLLQTVCADFADIGFAASYEGPDRLTYPCKPKSLARAMSNLVDNGTKFADTVVVRLTARTDGGVRIDVSDDGQGVAEELRDRVLEPFFKVNEARTANGGFGLGLSIVDDIVRGHDGTMQLLESRTGGLTVSIDLRAPTRPLSLRNVTPTLYCGPT